MKCKIEYLLLFHVASYPHTPHSNPTVQVEAVERGGLQKLLTLLGTQRPLSVKKKVVTYQYNHPIDTCTLYSPLRLLYVYCTAHYCTAHYGYCTVNVQPITAHYGYCTVNVHTITVHPIDLLPVLFPFSGFVCARIPVTSLPLCPEPLPVPWGAAGAVRAVQRRPRGVCQGPHRHPAL